MVCGGRDCPKCGVDAYKKLQNPAIDKLHSHWITDYIVAMQRPNNKSLEAGALADFKKKKVTAIFNLTEPGEHPFCGPGIVHECGFPYCPENFMHVGSKLILPHLMIVILNPLYSKAFQLFLARYDSSKHAANV